MADSEYGFLDRLLHRLALGFAGVAEASFDIDQATVRVDSARAVSQRHVFVSGLARAGTSVLMRRFHATGRYRSLTYRDMPFVLAPNLWRRISLMSRRDIAKSERAHGDDVLVDADSPESFDEVFWRIFSGDQYLRDDRLVAYRPDDEVVGKYVRYVNAILAASDMPLERYLSKNNNNILRLGALHQAFPSSLILIPFREPLQHAHSLLRQHKRFSKMQAEQRFVLRYMTWLGHHEFGLDHRPFQFDGSPRPPYTADTLNYWLHLWCDTYAWLERSKPEAALFVCYEDLCTRPEVWKRLAALADVVAEQEAGDPFRLSDKPPSDDFDRELANRAHAIYARLREQSRAAHSSAVA